MNSFVFPSLARPTFRYVVDSNYDFSSNPGNIVAECLYEFDTMGDGNVQHTPQYHVSRDNAEDVLKSLACALSPYDPEKCELLRCRFPCGVDARIVNFLASIRYKEGKRQFYSVSEMKVSAADSKRHDKRWTEVPTWADGTAPNVLALLNNEDGAYSRSFLESFARYSAVCEAMAARDLSAWPRPCKHFDVSDSVQTAFDAIKAIREVHRSLEFVASVAENFRFHAAKQPETVPA